VQVVWDLFHYGWPPDLDIFGDAFVDRFAALAAAFTRLVRDELPGPPVISPVNEISFFSWAAGTAALFHPFETGRGQELKHRLVRASIDACEAIRSVEPRARLVHPDPVIHVHPNPARPELDGAAASYSRAQWDGWNMISGRLEPGLGGDPRFLDILGLNFYPSNQWELEGSRVAPDDPRWRPFHEIAVEAYRRFGRPLLVTETGAEGAHRGPWLRSMVEEVERAVALGVPILGVCLYPILDHPGWDDGRHVRCGLWGFRRRGERRLDEGFAAEVRRAGERWRSRVGSR
jgi:hypothetical protein